MNPAILASAALLLIASTPKPEQLWGTWRLLSFARTVEGQTTEVFGGAPHGYINYGRDGRMLVLLVKAERPKAEDVVKLTDAQRAELFKTMVAYGGTYTFDGEKVVHHIDVSANEVWTGTDQVRHVRLEGNRLVLTTDPGPSSFDGKIGVGVLTFERVIGPRP
jgi:hypothetical protein